MKRDDFGLEPELEAFLRPRAIERHVPADVRARALERARAVVMSGGTIPATRPAAPRSHSVAAARSGRLFRVSLAASVAVALGAAAAYYPRSAPLRETPLREGLLPPPAVETASPPPAPAQSPAQSQAQAQAPNGAAVPRPGPAKAVRPARADADDDPVNVELALLQRAHAAFTRREFSAALTLVAEHARRFPSGHLAEQREALRVRSLVGSGRMDEAHRAAAAFAVRFPRSVLSPRLEAGPQAPQ